MVIRRYPITLVLQGRFSEQSDSDIASEREDGSGEEKSAFTKFSRDSGRLSILGYANDPYRWAEAADRQVQTVSRKTVPLISQYKNSC